MTTVTVPVAVANSLHPSGEETGAPESDAPRLLVCLRAATPLLDFAIEEARLRRATLYVLYVREVAVHYVERRATRLRWQDDPAAAAVLRAAIEKARAAGVTAFPVFAGAALAAPVIVDTACTLGADLVLIGGSQRHSMRRLMKGSVAVKVAESLPESIPLVIHG